MLPTATSLGLVLMTTVPLPHWLILLHTDKNPDMNDHFTPTRGKKKTARTQTLRGNCIALYYSSRSHGIVNTLDPIMPAGIFALLEAIPDTARVENMPLLPQEKDCRHVPPKNSSMSGRRTTALNRGTWEGGGGLKGVSMKSRGYLCNCGRVPG